MSKQVNFSFLFRKFTGSKGIEVFLLRSTFQSNASTLNPCSHFYLDKPAFSLILKFNVIWSLVAYRFLMRIWNTMASNSVLFCSFKTTLICLSLSLYISVCMCMHREACFIRNCNGLNKEEKRQTFFSVSFNFLLYSHAQT